jgi:P4 family phage/plasmid primase-like protien
MILGGQDANGKPPGVDTLLLPQHLADLRKSGLSDDYIRRCYFYSLQASARIQKVLTWRRYNGELGDCLAIPFTDSKGNRHGYIRLKPDRPRTNKEGKAVKYESPKGSSNRAYFPPDTIPVLNDPLVPLVIVEGEKKACKSDQEGFPCIGLVGVYGFQRKRKRNNDGKAEGERELIDDLLEIEWKDRIVSICFDSDAATNPQVRRAEWDLVETLRRHGAIVRVIRLPAGDPGPDGTSAKVGLDDFLVARGADAFRELLAAAVEPTPPIGIAALEAYDDPHRLARLFIQDRCQHADGLTLRRYKEEWHQWYGSAYQPLSEEELRAKLLETVKAEFDRLNLIAQKLAEAKGERAPMVRKVTKGLITNVEQALDSLTMLPGTISPPAYSDQCQWKSRNFIALSNGLLDLDILFTGLKEVLLLHTPRWFSPICLPYPFGLDADCLKWKAFLDHNLEGDVERIALLQEWFGYCLTPDTSRQKFMFFEGEGSNGKSVACAALESILGSENCSHVSLEVFGERFQLTPTLGKLVNIASEVGELDKAAEGILKSFTSGDPMQFDRKFKSPIQAVPTARLILSANNRPRFSDRSSGVWRRMILIPWRVVIAEDDPRRVFGMDKVEWWIASGELPGILNWGLAGLDRLRRQNQFTASKVCEQALAEYRIQNNPARMFLLEFCRDLTDSQTPCGELYKAYSEWCKSSGYIPLADGAFGKEVRRVFPKVEKGESRLPGRRMNVYRGLFFDRDAVI